MYMNNPFKKSKYKNSTLYFFFLIALLYNSCTGLSAKNQPIITPTIENTTTPVITITPTEAPIKDRGIIILNSKHDDLRFDYYTYFPFSLKRDDTVFVVIKGNQCCCTEEEESESIKGMISFFKYRLEKYKFAMLTPVIEKNCDKNVDDWVYHFPNYVFTDEEDRFYRIDEQIVLMINEYKRNLENLGLKVYPKVMFFGFSIDALFAERFSILQPENVLAIAVGGSAGDITIPEKSLDNYALTWAFGLYDFEKLTNYEFDTDNYKKTHQFHFWGTEDLEFYHLEENCRAGNSSACHWKNYWGETLTQALANQTNYLMDLGIDIEVKQYSGIGHDFTDQMRDDVFEYFDKIRLETLQ